MTFWTVYILTIFVAAPLILGIPLRTSDLGQNGHLVHYHRDELSGGHRRHIHYRPASKRTSRFHKTSRNTFFKNQGTPVNPAAAIYEVPSNRHYNDAMAGRVAIELRSLVDRTNSESNNTTDMKSDNSDSGDNNNNNGKHDNNNGKYETNNGKYDTYHEHAAHRLQNRDAPTPPSEALPNGNVHFPIEALPHGLQFLNRQSQERQLQNQASTAPEQSNGMSLDLNTLLGEILETTTSPSVTPSDSFMSNSPSLDIAFLLGDLGSAANDPGQNLGHQGHHHGHQGHSHGLQSHDHGHQGHDHGTQGQGHSHQGHDIGHGHQVHSQNHDHGHGAHPHGHDMNTGNNNGPNRNSIHDKVINSKASGRLENLFNGKFNQHSSHAPHSSHAHHGHGDHFHHEVNTLPSTNTVAAGSHYQKSTMHTRPITKRGVNDGDSISKFPKTFIDNILNIKIGSTTPPPVAVQTTRPTWYNGYITTPRSVETQVERLSGTDLNSVRQANRGLIRKDASSSYVQTPQETTTTPSIVSPTPKELVHLQGIHIMFSDGKQDNTGTIPTVHLTASLSDNVNHLLKMASGGSNAAPELPNVTSITDKITGTAVIRDGHLYLVVYPFGNNKSLELHYNQSTKRIPMPRNKPVSFSGVNKPQFQTPTPHFTEPVKPTVSLKTASSSRPSGHPSSVKPTSQTKVSSTGHADHHHVSTGSDIHSTSHTHGHVSKPDVSTNAGKKTHSHAHGHHQHHQHNMHHPGSPTPSLTGLKLAEVNDTTLQTLLAPIDRFVSPWDSLNFSKVFPYSAGNSSNKTSSKKTLEEDSEVDVVTFVAKATDPFNRMKVIIESLVNKTLSSDTGNMTNAKPEARFNFELKLQASNSQNTKDNLPSTTNPNNSEERAFDTNVKSTTTASVLVTDFSTTVKPFGEITQDSFGRSSAEITTPSKSIPNVLNGGNSLQTTTEINLPDVVTKSTTNMPDVNNRDNAGNSPAVPPTPNMHSKFDSILHVSENIAPSTTSRTNKRPSDFYGTTVSYVPNYTKRTFVRQPTYQITTPSSPKVFPENRKTIPRNMQVSQRRTTVLGSNLQPFVQRTSPNRFRQGLNRGQSEQIISLADILNDIRRIQLHNMQRFNIQNNNFDTMILNEAQQKPVIRTPIVMEGPVIRETSTRRYSDFPAFRNNRRQIHHQNSNHITPTPTPVQRRFGRQAPRDSAMEAMLVLSVDDIMADQTELHGAIVVSHRRDPAASNSI
ncbi:filaggrin-2-like [Mercenaria mercenaria]|uniref:filaggrin-2-like n=1 Tax=Mercenaria mercenaria TaxID=6596 RepID=UPI00234E9116|nr:filaggrin-2-like [Mercenaria mercenaria]